MTREWQSAYHSITLPYDDVICSFDCFDMTWEVLVNLVCSVSTDDDDLSGDPIWVDHFRQLAYKEETYHQES